MARNFGWSFTWSGSELGGVVFTTVLIKRRKLVELYRRYAGPHCLAKAKVSPGEYGYSATIYEEKSGMLAPERKTKQIATGCGGGLDAGIAGSIRCH